MYISSLEESYLSKKREDIKLTSTRLLSDREYQCMKLLAHGKRTKEIAHRLRLSTRTVETHINNIKLKIGPISSNPIVDYYWFYCEHKVIDI